MSGNNLHQLERDFLRALEEIESSRVAAGDYKFIELKSVCEKIGVDITYGLQVAKSLAKRRMILLDKAKGDYLVKSRTGHIIRSIYFTTTSIQRRLVRDVVDLKYLRFIKQIPRLSVSLTKKETIDAIIEFINPPHEPERRVLETAISAVASRYPMLSIFQFSAVKKILNLLNTRENGNSLVIVAETGAGKTLAYQLPLLLWILHKKAQIYIEKDAIEKNSLPLNCSALLIFPRNILAKEQYDELVELNMRIADSLRRMKLPSDFISFLQIRIERDFGGVDLEERTRIYQSSPDIIITNADTLKRRLMNALCSQLYKKGIDFVLYDEIHLYYGLFGAHVASLNARLQNVLPHPPVFVGMSATIANPQKHCQKLFSLKELPDMITDREDKLNDYSVEHHVIVKPRAGRPALGVCIDITSTLIHNRRNGLMEAHRLDHETRPKTLCFVDSLDLAGRWTKDQQDYEYFHPFTSVQLKFNRGYPIYFAPFSSKHPDQRATCMNCKTGRDVIASVCSEYLQGLCWWFSQDNGSPVRWQRLNFKVTPSDNVRVKRLTSQEVELSELEDIYGLFTHQRIGLPLDALIATSVLEVGVDFKNIKEVVMYGEIRSPASYKQKAGRGAREGNLDEGLFVLTIIPPSPLANFYYRHFYRLVYPSLSPLPLEPRNSDIVSSHAFCAVFDFLAQEGIDVFNVIAANKDPKQVENDFDAALSYLRKEKEKIKDFVARYLHKIGYSPTKARTIAEEAVGKALHALNKLSSEYEIKDEKKKLVIWVFEAFRESEIMAMLEDKIKEDLDESRKIGEIVNSRISVVSAIKRFQEATKILGKRYYDNIIRIKQILSEVEGYL
jgi:superfamily II DNA/RNA helicase